VPWLSSSNDQTAILEGSRNWARRTITVIGVSFSNFSAKSHAFPRMPFVWKGLRQRRFLALS
jgi:hypothetical protein